MEENESDAKKETKRDEKEIETKDTDWKLDSKLFEEDLNFLFTKDEVCSQFFHKLRSEKLLTSGSSFQSNTIYNFVLEPLLDWKEKQSLEESNRKKSQTLTEMIENVKIASEEMKSKQDQPKGYADSDLTRFCQMWFYLKTWLLEDSIQTLQTLETKLSDLQQQLQKEFSFLE